MSWLDFFKKDNITQKVDKGTLTKEQTVNTILMGIISDFKYVYVLDEKIPDMMNDLDIKSGIDVRMSKLLSYERNIMSNDGSDTEFLLEQFNNINLDDVISIMYKSKYTKRTFQEVIWNNDYTIGNIKEHPNSIYYRDNDGWYYADKQGLKTYLTPEKYLIAINDGSDYNWYGDSDLKYLLQVFELKQTAMLKWSSIVKKYGEIIKWYAYDKRELGTDGTDLTKIKARAEKIASMTDSNVIGIPTSDGQSSGLNNTFGFITLDQFKTEVHQALIKWCQDQITKWATGATLTQAVGTSGSYALGQVHQDTTWDLAKSDINYIQNQLQQLIWALGKIQGFDSTKYSFRLEKPLDRESVEKLNNLKASKINTLKQAGYTVKVETVEKELGYLPGEIEVVQNGA